MTTGKKAHALARDEIVNVLSPISGFATYDGTTNTFIDVNLIGRNDFVTGKQVEILDGPSQFETLVASGFDPVTGQITLGGNYSHSITAGTGWKLLNLGGGLTASQAAQLAAIATQTNKLAGQAPVSGAAIQPWFTSESDIVSIGDSGVNTKVNDLSISIRNLVGTVITVRMYKQINGSPDKFFETDFDATTDPPGIILLSFIAIHDVVDITLQSNNPADDGKGVDYDYMLEAQ